MSKGQSYGQEWEDDVAYDQQYRCDIASCRAELDYCCLYVTGIPWELDSEGLRRVFEPHGAVIKVYLHRDKRKHFAFVTFQSPGDAKSVMMKLNRAPPFRFNITVAYKKDRVHRDRHSYRDDEGSVGSRGNYNRNQEEVDNAEQQMEDTDNDELGLESGLDPDIHLELELLKLEHLKLQEAQVQCKQRMLLLNCAGKKTLNVTTSGNSNRSVLPDDRIVMRNVDKKNGTPPDVLGSGAGDSKERGTVCSCKSKIKRWEAGSSTDDGTSTPSTCVLCSEDRSEDCQDKSDLTSKITDVSKKSRIGRSDSKFGKFTSTSKSVGTELTSKRSEYSKQTDASKSSDVTSKRVVKRVAKRSEGTCDFKYSDLYSDNDDEGDETNKLIELRSTDYAEVVEDGLRVVVALAGYPKAKMRLQQIEQFQRSINDVMGMQLKAGLLKKVPSFLDYYLNRGAIVCICKDVDTKDWMVRVSPGLQERMCNNLILLKAKVKRLCLAVLRIPDNSWPATAQDAFKLLQYFNPTLKTNLWRIYAQKFVDNVECTSFLLDRVSGEIIRGPSFKNIIDYSQMEFELTGYSEIYYECLLSDMEEDLCSVASRVKLLSEIRSNESTPRNTVTVENETVTIGTKKDEQEKDKEESECVDVEIEEITDKSYVMNDTEVMDGETPIEEVRKDMESDMQKEILIKLKDVKYISDNNEVIVWTDENNAKEEFKESETNNNDVKFDVSEFDNNPTSSAAAVSENTSVIESYDNLHLSRNSNLNIDSNRGIAYYRRTNYLHVENELKIAITLEGYPQNKLEGTHIRRLKQLFKEYLHKDMKSQRFTNLIIPKFQDVYLSNGAVIYISDSLETKDYLTEVLPKFINATGLKLMFREVKNLVRYTRIVMRLPEKLAHVESVEILFKLQNVYPNLKPECWKYYSDVAGKQKRQFGVDPESLEVIRSPEFDPTYEGEKIGFKIIDRQRRDVSFEDAMKESDFERDGVEVRKLKDRVLKSMYCPIDAEIMNAPLTRIRTNHYSDIIDDDLKLYVGPSNYPETRVDEVLFHSIKRAFENIAFDTHNGELDIIPKIHDMYLFDGVIFIICKDMASREWIEGSLTHVNSKLQIYLKATEFRGPVGIISMVLKTHKDTDEVISILQNQNPRLRTKYWRKISTVRTKTKLDVVLQIDKLSAQVISGKGFNKFVGKNAVHFKLGHLQSLIKPQESLEELCKKKNKLSNLAKSDKQYAVKHQMKSNFVKSIVENQENSPHSKTLALKSDEKEYMYFSNYVTPTTQKEDNGNEHRLSYPNVKDFDPVIVNSESPKSNDGLAYHFDNQNSYCKLTLKIPVNILPENKDDLNVIFDLLEDKNPGLNTELWQVTPDSRYPKGKFDIIIDKQSATVIKGKNFDPTLAGEKLKFVLPHS